MSRAFAKKFYKSKAWASARALVIEHQHNLCADCLERGEITPIEEVHHKRPLTPENIHDPSVSLALDNLVGLCHRCHEARHKYMGTYGTRPKETRVWFDENGIPHKKEDVR